MMLLVDIQRVLMKQEDTVDCPPMKDAFDIVEMHDTEAPTPLSNNPFWEVI